MRVHERRDARDVLLNFGGGGGGGKARARRVNFSATWQGRMTLLTTHTTHSMYTHTHTLSSDAFSGFVSSSVTGSGLADLSCSQ